MSGSYARRLHHPILRHSEQHGLLGGIEGNAANIAMLQNEGQGHTLRGPYRTEHLLYRGCALRCDEVSKPVEVLSEIRRADEYLSAARRPLYNITSSRPDSDRLFKECVIWSQGGAQAVLAFRRRGQSTN